MKAAGDINSVFLGGLRQKDYEFVAAVAEGKVDQPAISFERVTHLREEPRADQVAVGVIYLLEVIKIDKNNGKFIVVTLRPVDFRIEDETHMARVIKRGAVIFDGEFMDALYVTRVFQCNRGKIGKGFEELEITGVKTIGTHTVD